jgi:hypothetical protein
MLARVTAQLGLLWGPASCDWELLAVRPIATALPVVPPGTPLRRPIAPGGLVIAGDHRDTPSIQGALVSGRRAAESVLGTTRLTGA